MGKKKKESINVEKTFKYGLGAGILGAFVGAPGIGMTIGVLAANKKPIKKFVKKQDKKLMKLFK